MLKLKKHSAEGDFSIILRDKESLFTRPLIQAFLLAAALHLSFLLIFHIAPFKIRWNQMVFPPVEVEASIDSQDTSLVIEMTGPVKYASNLPVRPESFPAISVSVYPLIEKAKNEVLLATPFKLAMEETLSERVPPPPFQVVLSGPLSEYFSVAPGSINEKELIDRVKIKDASRILYDIVVKNDTGAIFWYERKESSSSPALVKEAEEVLKSLRLDSAAKNRDQFVTTGTIEMQFNPGSL